jgi:hypothetical protein
MRRSPGTSEEGQAGMSIGSMQTGVSENWQKRWRTATESVCLQVSTHFQATVYSEMKEFEMGLNSNSLILLKEAP